MQVYNPDAKEFVSFNSLNPLYSAADDKTLTINDISKEALLEEIRIMCGGVAGQTGGLRNVTVKDKDGKTTTYDCSGANKKIVLTIPSEPKELEEYMESVIKEAETNGVTIELNPAYGNGANKEVVKPAEETEEGGN